MRLCRKQAPEPMWGTLENPSKVGRTPGQTPWWRLAPWPALRGFSSPSAAGRATPTGWEPAILDVNKDGWQLAPGAYKLMVGGSSKSRPDPLAGLAAD